MGDLVRGVDVRQTSLEPGVETGPFPLDRQNMYVIPHTQIPSI